MRNFVPPLAWALLGGGLAVVTSAGALDLPWLHAARGPATPQAQVAQVTQAAQLPTTLPAADPLPALQPGTAPNYRAIVQRYGPSVVGVLVEGRRVADADAADAQAALPRGWRPGAPQGAQPFRGQGSGFIVAADGLILTNAHVVKDAQSVTVLLADRREYTAQVLGSDTATDIAVLRIPAQGLPPVRLGQPAQLQVGDPVLAIGAPYGLAQTATAGIVSATGRSLPGDGAVPFIQTDAAVNPGNSGGPLFDAAGNVVGINAQIYSRTGGFQGVSFAIPVDVAMKVKDQLQKTGKVSRGKLGVGVQPVTKELAESFGLEKPVGALISLVEKGSAAEKAGVQPGDVILSVNGTALKDTTDLPRTIGELSPGSRVALSVWRQKAARDVIATLGEASEGAAPAAEPEPDAGPLGLSLRALNANEAQQLGVTGGLAVEAAKGVAALSGVQPGDVILAVNNQPVTDAKQFGQAVKAAGKRVALLIQRGPSRIYLPLKIQ